MKIPDELLDDIALPPHGRGGVGRSTGLFLVGGDNTAREIVTIVDGTRLEPNVQIDKINHNFTILITATNSASEVLDYMYERFHVLDIKLQECQARKLEPWLSAVLVILLGLVLALVLGSVR